VVVENVRLMSYSLHNSQGSPATVRVPGTGTSYRTVVVATPSPTPYDGQKYWLKISIFLSESSLTSRTKRFDWLRDGHVMTPCLCSSFHGCSSRETSSRFRSHGMVHQDQERPLTFDPLHLAVATLLHLLHSPTDTLLVVPPNDLFRTCFHSERSLFSIGVFKYT
jgi:hypothetical protein